MKPQPDNPLHAIRAQIQLAAKSHKTPIVAPAKNKTTALENLTELLEAGHLERALRTFTEDLEATLTDGQAPHLVRQPNDVNMRAAAGIRNAIRELEAVLDILEKEKA
jgi:hypothetical protein